MKYLKRKVNYSDEEFKQIEYGLTGIYLTISKIIIISLIAFCIGILKDMFIFMLIFNIIRTTAFGLHATKSWICLLSSSLIFLGIPLICIFITISIYFKAII